MLQRSLTRRLSHAAPVKTCTTCVCSCGQRFIPNVVQRTQRRHKGAKLNNAHPSVYRRKTNEGRNRVLSPAERRERQKQEESDHQWHLTSIERASRLNVISSDSEAVIDFLNTFADLCRNGKSKGVGSCPVNLEEFKEVVAEADIPESDYNWMAHCLLRSPKEDDNAYGKKLMLTLSYAGSEPATMKIVKHALLEGKQRPAKLNASEIKQSRKHLKQVADKGENYRAMVLQGKVEYALGNHNAAIQLWTDAMDAAVANARELAELRARRKAPPRSSDIGENDFYDLETPWIELSSIHMARQEWAKTKYAINIGCEMDDPTSHYYAGIFEKKTNESGEFTPTSAWVYHMTKAAASGHPKAAHELGYFYAHSLWPYIEDEPPDEIKPTPFDTYPPENENTSKDRFSLSDTMRQLVGLQTRRREQPSENIFKTAIFPFDPAGRMRIALQWLEIATSRTYAPSFLLAAKLRLEKTLWADAATPKEALDMTDERYKYATKADAEADNPIKRDEAKADDGPDAKQEELPNPFYDTETAYEQLRQVFHAHRAQRARAEILAYSNSARRLGRRIDELDVEDVILTEEGMASTGDGGRGQPPEVRVFFRFPEIREMYSDDVRGVMFDDTGPGVGDLFEAAREMCEEMGWDVYDEQGGLMYRHGLGGKGRPAVAAAAAAGGV